MCLVDHGMVVGTGCAGLSVPENADQVANLQRDSQQLNLPLKHFYNRGLIPFAQSRLHLMFIRMELLFTRRTALFFNVMFKVYHVCLRVWAITTLFSSSCLCYMSVCMTFMYALLAHGILY